MGKRYRDLVRAHGSTARGNTRAVLNVMADYANDDGICKAGYQTLADDCGVTKRTITNCIQRLVELGEIEIVDGGRGRGRVTNFRLLVAEKVKIFPVLEEEKVKEIPPLDAEKVKTVHAKGENGAQKGENGADRSIYKNLYEPEQREPRPAAATPATAPDEAQASFNAVYGTTGREDLPGSNGRLEQRSVVEHQAMFGALCEAIGADPATLTAKRRAQVAQTGTTLRTAGYLPEDVGRFMMDVWFRDWRWTTRGERPRLDQVQDEIGKIRAGIPVNIPASTSDQTGAYVDSAVAKVRAQLESTGRQYG